MFRSGALLSGLLALGAPLFQEPAPSLAARVQVLPAESGEFFVLEQVGADGLTRSAGSMVLSRHEQDGERSLELEMHFSEGDFFVRAVETRNEAGEKLVWRELGEHALRSLVASLPARETTVEISTWGMGEPLHRSIATEWNVQFPLGCIEALRRGEKRTELARIWPLSSQVEVVQVHPIDLASPEVPASWCSRIAEARSDLRAYQLVRDDGSKGESFLFDGEDLVALSLQPGGVCARRIEAAQYEELAGPRASPASETPPWEALGERPDERTTEK
jgi:hypothetical protein